MCTLVLWFPLDSYCFCSWFQPCLVFVFVHFWKIFSIKAVFMHCLQCPVVWVHILPPIQCYMTLSMDIKQIFLWWLDELDYLCNLKTAVTAPAIRTLAKSKTRGKSVRQDKERAGLWPPPAKPFPFLALPCCCLSVTFICSKNVCFLNGQIEFPEEYLTHFVLYCDNRVVP